MVSRDYALAKIACLAGDFMRGQGRFVPDDLLMRVEMLLKRDFDDMLEGERVWDITYYIGHDGLASCSGPLDKTPDKFFLAWVPCSTSAFWVSWRDVYLRDSCGDCSFDNYIRYVAHKLL